jgi:membrane protease subunit (stomatin/prohibitin family)
MVTINIGTKPAKKKTTSKKSSPLKTANDSVRLANNVLTVDKKARDAKAAKAKDKDAKASKVCSKCGKTDTSGAAFCPSCGTKMEKTCMGCGKKDTSGAAFCPGCGNRLD